MAGYKCDDSGAIPAHMKKLSCLDVVVYDHEYLILTVWCYTTPVRLLTELEIVAVGVVAGYVRSKIKNNESWCSFSSPRCATI